MGSLGSLGVVHAPADKQAPVEPDTFDWFGTDIRATDSFDEIELIDVMAGFRSIEAGDIQAWGAIKQALQLLIYEDDWAVFWALARENKQEIQDLMAVFRTLLLRPADRPTQPLPDSSSGQRSTAANSPAVSPSQESRGRPDRQIIHDDMADFKARKVLTLTG